MGICSSSSGAEPGTNAPSQDPSPHQEPAPKAHDSSQATKKRSSASPPEPSSKPAAVSPGLGLHSSAVAQRSPVGSPHHQQQAGEQHDRHQHDDEQQDDDDDEQQLQDDDHDHDDDDDDVSVSVSASVSASASAAEDDAEAEAAEDGDEVDDGTGYEPYASFRRQSTTLNAFLLTPSIELLHEYDRTVPPREPSAQHGPGDAEDRHARGPSMGGYDAALGNFSAEELYSDYGGYGDYTYDEGDDVEVLHTAKAKVKAKGDGDADSNNGDEDDGEHRYDGIESVEALVNSNGDPVSLEELAVSTGSSEFQLGSVTGKAAVVWEHSHIIQPLSQLAGLDARYRTAHIKSREQLEAAARGRDWNDEFQRLHERVENTPYGAQERQRALELLRADFVDFCTPVVQVLVEEVELGVPVEERVVQPDKSTAGTAGGEKFKVGGVLFKFARDWKGIYGSEALAQKAATLDVTGLNAITACNLPLLHTSLTAVFRVRGYCISAIALAPIGDAKSLVYGSEDAGRRIRDSSPAMRVLMGQVATVLNLKAHRVRDKKKREFTLHMAVDVEGHRSPVDGRFYLVDAGRLCPPMPPRPGRHRDFLTALFRPEFLRRHCAGRPLSADAFSRFGHLDHDEHHSDILAAYKLLATEVFPALAKTLVEAMQHPDEGKDDGNKSDSELSDAGNISDGGEQVSVVREAPDFELDEELDEALLPQLLLWFSAPLSQLFHESGVNMRFVPRIRAELHALRKSDDEAAAWARTPAADRLSEVLLHETICRTIKTRFREWLRKARSPDQVDWLIYRLLALLCGNGAKTDGVDPMAVGFWRFLLVDDLVSKYGPRMAKHILNDTEALRVALAEYGAWLKHFADADAPASASVAGRFLFRLVCSLRLEMPARRFPGELIDGVHRLGRSALNYAEESVGPLTDLVSGALLFHGDDPRSYPVDVDVYPAVKHVAVRQFLPLDKAQQSLEEELAHREAALGSDVHPQLCTSLGALLELFRIWSEDEPAISFQRGSAVAERILGIWRAYRAEQQTPASDQQQRARVHAELFAQVLKVGSFYAHFDAYVQARNVFQEAVDSVKDDREASYEYAQAMRRLGQILSRLGSYHKYVELAQASLDILRRVRLGDHPDTAEALDDLGTAFMLTGDFEQSTQLLNESLAMYQRVLSTSDHPDIARVLLHIGYNHWKIGQPKLMEAKLLQSVEVFQKVYGYAHPRVAEALTTLSVCVEGRHEYRMQQLAEALRIEKLVFGGEDSPRVARILRQMAIIHGEMGQHEIREELLLRALQAQRAAFAGRQHPELFRTLTQLALCYVDLEQPDRLLYILDNHLPPTSEIMEENSSISLLVRGLGTGNYGYVNELVEGAVRLLGEDNRHIKVLKTMQTRVAAKHTSRLASSVMIGSG